MPRLISLSAIALILLSILPAQAKDTIRTICFVPVHEQKEFFYLDKGKAEPLPLPSRNLSEPLEHDSSLPILIGQPDPAAQDGFKIHAKIQPDKTRKDTLLIFIPKPEDKEFPYQVFAFDGSEDQFKPGSLLMINLSKTQVGGTIGGSKVLIKPLSFERLPAPKEINKDNNYFVTLSTLDGQHSRPLCKTYWPHKKKIRRLIFVFNDPSRNSTRLMGVPYPVPPKEDKQKQAQQN